MFNSQTNRLDVSFNRTFMELKSSSARVSRIEIRGFNRTFMELKFHYIFLEFPSLLVLIVPLWN